MTWMIVSFIMLFGFYQSGRSLLHPQDQFYMGIASEPPPCYLYEEAIEKTRKGKVSQYDSYQGHFCPRDIFDYKERDSFEEFVTRNAQPQANRYMFVIDRLNRIDELLSYIPPVYVDTSTIDNPKIASYLHSVFVTSLTQAFGQGRVVRQYPASQKARVLKIQVRQVIFPDILFDVRLSAPTDKPIGIISSWQTL